MSRKPTYEELEYRVKGLEKADFDRNQKGLEGFRDALYIFIFTK